MGGVWPEALQSLSRRTYHLQNRTCRDCCRDAREVQSPGSKHRLKAGTAVGIQLQSWENCSLLRGRIPPSVRGGELLEVISPLQSGCLQFPSALCVFGSRL